jgi:hypothetical protein
LFAALQQQPSHFLDEERHSASARGDVVDHGMGQCVACRKLADHVTNLGAIKRR